MSPRITALIAHFDDLNRAHEAVLKAKRQVELLTPLVADCDRYTEIAARCEELRACREALKPYFARLKLGLLEKRIAALDNELVRLNTQVARLEERKQGQQAEERELRRSIAENGGDRIERIREEICQKEEEQARRRKKAEDYAELVRSLGLVPPEDDDAFLAQQREFAALKEQTEAREAELQNEQNEVHFAFAQGREEHKALMDEIESLKARRSNIDAQQIAMRAALCQALNLSEDEMPFAGELIQVREEEREWEGAAERLLRNFGLSMLVPDVYYTRVAEWWTAPISKDGWFTSSEGKPAWRATQSSSDSLVHQARRQARFGLLRLAGTRARPPLRLCLLRHTGTIPPRTQGHYPPARSRRPANATKGRPPSLGRP